MTHVKPAQFFLNLGIIRLVMHTMFLLISFFLILYICFIPGLWSILLALRYRTWARNHNIMMRTTIYYLMIVLGFGALVFGILSMIPLTLGSFVAFYVILWLCVYAGDFVFISLYFIHRNDESMLQHHHHHHPEVVPLVSGGYPIISDGGDTFQTVRVSYQPPPPPPHFQNQPPPIPNPAPYYNAPVYGQPGMVPPQYQQQPLQQGAYPPNFYQAGNPPQMDPYQGAFAPPPMEKPKDPYAPM